MNVILATNQKHFADAFRIRTTVFIGEQSVPVQEEIDDYDCFVPIFIAYEDEKALGTARVIIKNKDIAKINWNLSAQKIHNLIRGLNPWPIATTSYGDLTMKIYKSHVENVNSEKVPGTIISVDKNGIKVATEEGVLVIEKLQFPNGKPLFVEQFINGNKIDIGTILK